MNQRAHSYEEIERRRYEGFWKSLHGGFSTNNTHYSSAQPEPAVLEFLNFLKRKNISTGKLLDIGCGNGRNTIACANRSFDVIGIDFSNNAIDIAQQWAARDNIKCTKFLTANALALPFPNNSFAVAIDTGCFH